MVEYINHHWCNAKSWAKMEGGPSEVARQLIMEWNDPMKWAPDSDQPFRTYPLTDEFIGAVANLILAIRTSTKVKLLPDGPDGPPDALCLARGGCDKRKI